MKEVWKDIPGFEGLYQASNLGSVRSLDRKVFQLNKGLYPCVRSLKGKILKPLDNGNGYLYVHIGEGKKAIHRLILNTFSPNKESSKLHVNHKDFNKSNNKISNLEWVTCQQNNKHLLENKRVNFTKGENSHKSKLTNKDVIEIKKMLIENEWYKNNISKNRLGKPSKKEIADKFNISSSVISQISKNKIWKHIQIE